MKIQVVIETKILFFLTQNSLFYWSWVVWSLIIFARTFFRAFEQKFVIARHLVHKLHVKSSAQIIMLENIILQFTYIKRIYNFYNFLLLFAGDFKLARKLLHATLSALFNFRSYVKRGKRIEKMRHTYFLYFIVLTLNILSTKVL